VLFSDHHLDSTSLIGLETKDGLRSWRYLCSASLDVELDANLTLKCFRGVAAEILFFVKAVYFSLVAAVDFVILVVEIYRKLYRT